MPRLTRAILLLALVACTPERLQPPRAETRAAVDNLVRLEADFCTRPPREEKFPVKVLLILDASGSLQFLDEGGLRVSAVRQLLSRYEGDEQVLFNLIQFNSLIYQAPANGQFVQAQDVGISDVQLQLAEVQTDYQAALSRAYQTLLQDMTANSALVPNTKYVVLFFSDGQPSPVCCPCEEETSTPTGTQGFTCDANGNPDPPPPSTVLGGITYEQRYCEGQGEQPLCNGTPLGGRFMDAYADLDVNGSYNRGYQIDQLMRDIVDLSTTFEAGSFQFHTILLHNPNLPDAIRQIVQVDYPASSARMRSMARIGSGTYVEARTANDLDFLQFDYTAIKRAYGLRRVFATNLNAHPGPLGPLVDSDGDGVHDTLEDELGTNFLSVDTDGDGYRDLIEVALSDRGLDPLDAQLPFQPCMETSDDDRDLLLDCEEDILGTRQDHPDSDADTIPDALELRYGTDATRPDADLDYDFDGVANGAEISRHTDPRTDDPIARDKHSYYYDLRDTAETLDGRTCFSLTVRNVQLAGTQGRDSLNQPGWNDLYIWEVESKQDNAAAATTVRAACFWARYLPPDYKDPLLGRFRRIQDTELRPLLGVGEEEPFVKCWGPQLPGGRR